MDSDLSLIEISEADDSLLQQENSNEDACNVYLSCSPLCSIRPKPSPRASSKLGSEDAEIAGPASSKDSFNKENVNANKSDTVKLSLDPQQMKRKKKGGYNLRKSLAWDRAFFTEEGVLDPEELSIISGNVGWTGGEKLSIIHEEESESLSDVPEGQDNSADLRLLEEKLFKDLPAVAAKSIKTKTPLRTPLKHSGVTKNNVVQPSPTPKAKRMVLSAQDVNQSGSKFSSGARPTASSLTGNLNATKVSNKETKARRLPFSKQEPTAISSTSKSSVTTGQLKRTQPPQPLISAQKNLRVKSSSNYPRTAESTALVGPGGKSSTSKPSLPQAKRTLSKASNKTRSSTLETHLEGIQDPTTMPAPRIQSEHDDGSRTTGISLPQKIPAVAGPRQNVQIPSAKPSGLRMPSPSMGFFGQQAKASATRSLSQIRTQSDRAPQPTSSSLRIPSSVKALNELRPSYSSGKMSEVVNGIANENTQLNLRQGFSSTVSLRPGLHEKKNPHLESHSSQQLKLKTKHNLRSETSSAQHDLKSKVDDANKKHQESTQPCEIGKRLQIGDEEMKMKEKLHHLQRKSCITPRENSDEMANDVSREDGDKNHEEVDKSKLTSYVTLALEKRESSKGSNIVDCQPMEDSSSRTSITCSLSTQSKHPDVSGSGNYDALPRLQQTEPSEDLHERDLSMNSNISVVPRGDTAIEKRRSQDLYGAEDKEHEKDSVGMRNSSKKLKIVEDAENPFLDSNTTTERSSRSPSGSVLEDQFIKYNDGEGQAELSCCTAAEDMQDVEKSLNADGLLRAGNHGSEINISNASCPEPQTLETTSCDFVDATVVFCEEAKSKDQLTGSTTNSTSFSSKLARDDFGAMEMNHQPTMSHMFSTVELEDTSSVVSLVEEVSSDKHCPRDVDHISSTLPWDNNLLTSNPDVHKEPSVHVGSNNYASGVDIPPQGFSVGGSSEMEQSRSNMAVGSTDPNGIITTETDYFQVPLQKQDVDPNGDEPIEDTEAAQKQLGTDCLSDVCRKSIMSSSASKTRSSLVADQDFGFDECHENQDSIKVENDLQPTEGMSGQDFSLRETLQEEMVNGCNSSEPVQTDHCMKAEANIQVEDITCTLLNEIMEIDMDIEDDVSAEMIWEEIQELQNVDHSRVSCSLDDDLCPSSGSTKRELSVSQVGIVGSKVESSTLPADHLLTQQVTDDNSAGENNKTGIKQDAAIVKPPPDAPPFSDEWLAAFEAAGEEILTMKSGKVQNSPPDKTLPEPGPWSPVKKKQNQAIGPFDCTKCTNINLNVPESSSQ